MDLREHFEQALGLTLSNDWYRDCYAALQQRQQRNIISSDMILEQILYQDLRDVVRDNQYDMRTQSSSSVLSTQAQLLRNAVTESQQQPNETRTSTTSTSKITLPSSFRCCLQVDEICDVSKNAESRLTHPNSTSSSSCHKIGLIDGYYPGSTLVAIEVVPIFMPGTATPKLLPGTKVLLFGPVIVRNGMIGIHSGNCIILGGQVERLVQIQNQAIEQAKQLSGHGIDPTIRALIWNKHNDIDGIDDENGDEGEHESSDVAPGQPMTGPQHLLQQQQQPIVQAQPVPVTQVIQRLSYPRMVATIPTQQHRQNDIRSNPDQHESSSGMITGLNAVGSLSTNIQNPYATIVPVVLPQNRYATQSRVQPTSNINAVSATSQLTRLNPDAIIPSIVPNSINNNQGTVMTCSQFHDFLIRILQNEQEYSEAMNKVYTVGPMQQIGPKIYFNIEKANKRHKQWHDINTSPTSTALSSGSENKQHDYVMIAKFGIGDDKCSQGLATCRISNAILEPHFSVSATELRQLSRVDRTKSDSIVRDCGKVAQQCLYQLRKYEVVLDRHVEEVFHSAMSKPQLDGDDPFLFLKSVK